MAVIEQGNLIEGVAPRELIADLTITSAQILALHSAAQTLISAPGAGRAIVLNEVIARKPAGTAYAGIGGTEDLEFRYNNATGAEAFDIETVSFLDQSGEEVRIAHPDAGQREPVVDAPIVVHLGGAITTGNSPLNIRAFYRIVDVP